MNLFHERTAGITLQAGEGILLAPGGTYDEAAQAITPAPASTLLLEVDCVADQELKVIVLDAFDEDTGDEITAIDVGANGVQEVGGAASAVLAALPTELANARRLGGGRGNMQDPAGLAINANGKLEPLAPCPNGALVWLYNAAAVDLVVAYMSVTVTHDPETRLHKPVHKALP